MTNIKPIGNNILIEVIDEDRMVGKIQLILMQKYQRDFSSDKNNPLIYEYGKLKELEALCLAGELFKLGIRPADGFVVGQGSIIKPKEYKL